MSNFSSINNLSCSIIKLQLTEDFNQCIDYLPNSLMYISFNELEGYNISKFNQTIDNLPNSVKYLKLNKFFNHTIDNLPDSIIKISFSYTSIFNQTFYNLPNSLEHLVLGNSYDKEINNYEYLHYKKYFTLELTNVNYSHMDNLPNFITNIILPYKFNKPINNLPHLVNEIELNDNFNQDISLLPNSITHLILKCDTANI